MTDDKIRSPIVDRRFPLWTEGDVDRILAHRASFKTIWTPYRDNCYAWCCKCPKGLMCPWLASYQRTDPNAHKDFEFSTDLETNQFSLAIPMYGLLLYRFKVMVIEQTDWDGTTNSVLEFTVPTGLGEQTRYYNESDWADGACFPIAEVYKLVTGMLTDTAQGVAVMQQARQLAYGMPRAMYCEGKIHNIGTNMALIAKIKQKDHTAAETAIQAHAFSMLHTSKCLICACNEEMAFNIVPDSL